MTKIERYKEALDLAIGELSKKARHTYPDGVTCEEACHKVLLAIGHILNPPPEYEDMPIERWAVVAPSGFVKETFSSEGGAVIAVDLPRYEGYTVARLTGTIRREKVAPAERSVTVNCKINQYGAVHSSSSDLCLLRDYPEFHNSKGSITFTTTDPPK
jgi:hypothetical protein